MNEVLNEESRRTGVMKNAKRWCDWRRVTLTGRSRGLVTAACSSTIWRVRVEEEEEEEERDVFGTRCSE